MFMTRLPKDTQRILDTKLPELTKITATKPVTLLHAQDVEVADQLLIKLMQRYLTKNNRRKWDYLGLYKDENDLLRCRGRLKAKYLTRDIREPILLLPDQHLTTLIIQDTHERCGHQALTEPSLICALCCHRQAPVKQRGGTPAMNRSLGPLTCDRSLRASMSDGSKTIEGAERGREEQRGFCRRTVLRPDIPTSPHASCQRMAGSKKNNVELDMIRGKDLMMQ
ncbi:hypothetical protein OSTOST_01941, partial [Ostertagia ostertagi]